MTMKKAMKTMMIVGALLGVSALNAAAQGMYFDIGLGLGFASTSIDGKNVNEELATWPETNFQQIASDYGFKIGYGPIARSPLYVAAHFNGSGHRFQDGSDYVLLNSFLIGPSVMYYPTHFLQLSASLGYSNVANTGSYGGDDVRFPMGEGGVAWDASAAFDIGNPIYGCLIGLKYFGAHNGLKDGTAQDQHNISLFVKYTMRWNAKKV